MRELTDAEREQIDDHMSSDDECWNCGGEGYVYNCFEEYACVNPEDGCDECMRRCDVCNARPMRLGATS
jgi:hypothetical protein